jgi:hypothetical protein
MNKLPVLPTLFTLCLVLGCSSSAVFFGGGAGVERAPAP